MNDKEVYKHPISYAKENGEVEIYRASRKLNIACADAICKAIRNNYRDNCLDSAGVTDVIKEYGFDRVLYVLANTVQQQDWDGRYSQDNKQWAKTVTLPEDNDYWGNSRNTEFVVHGAHPGLVNLFTSLVRKEFKAAKEMEGRATVAEKEPSVRDKLKAIQPEAKSKTVSHHKENAR